MNLVSSLDVDKYFLLQAQFDRMKLIDPMLFLFSGDEFVEDLVFLYASGGIDKHGFYMALTIDMVTEDDEQRNNTILGSIGRFDTDGLRPKLTGHDTDGGKDGNNGQRIIEQTRQLPIT